MNTGTITDRAGRYGRLLFVGTVTAVLLAYVLESALHGPDGALGAVIYAFAAGFGLEFVSAVWTGRGTGGRTHTSAS